MTSTQTFLTQFFTGLLVTAGLLSSVTLTEAASGATRATMIEVNATTTAFVISYEFGFLNRTTLMPAVAIKSTGEAPVTTHPPLVYSYRDRAGATTSVPVSAAVVWSTAT